MTLQQPLTGRVTLLVQDARGERRELSRDTLDAMADELRAQLLGSFVSHGIAQVGDASGSSGAFLPVLDLELNVATYGEIVVTLDGVSHAVSSEAKPLIVRPGGHQTRVVEPVQ